MGVFRHVVSKKAKRLSKQTVRPLYRVGCFVLIGLAGLYVSLFVADPAARMGKAPHPHSAYARRHQASYNVLLDSSPSSSSSSNHRRLSEETFTSAESAIQCRIDQDCAEFTTEAECDSPHNATNCQWYPVLGVCQHSTALCANVTNKLQCDQWCPSYNWTYYNLTSAVSMTDFSEVNWTELRDNCPADNNNATDIVCNCSGYETLAHHNECAHEIFGVPPSLVGDTQG